MNSALDIEIDKLTNSIENSVSGDSFDTEVTLLDSTDLKNVSKRKGWIGHQNINWRTGKYIN